MPFNNLRSELVYADEIEQRKKLDHLSDELVRDLLAKLLVRLDDAEKDDFFGTEGWKHYFDLEESFDIV